MPRIIELWVGDKTVQQAIKALEAERERLREGDAPTRRTRDVELALDRLREARRSATIRIAGWS